MALFSFSRYQQVETCATVNCWPAACNEEVSFSGFFSAQTIKTDQVENEREETEVEGIEDWFVRQEEKVIILSWNYSGTMTPTTHY